MVYFEGQRYSVIEVICSDGPWECDCGAQGATLCDLAPIEAAALTPGDPSPAGRCPRCDCLVHPGRGAETGKTVTTSRPEPALSAFVAALNAVEAKRHGAALPMGMRWTVRLAETFWRDGMSVEATIAAMDAELKAERSYEEPGNFSVSKANQLAALSRARNAGAERGIEA